MGKKLKHLERTMRTFQNVDRMEYEPIVSALHECIEADEYVYTYMRNEGEQTAFFPLRNEEGDVFIPVFLSVLSAKALEEQAREYKLSLALFKFSGLPDLADISDSISGLVFEPFDFGFIATGIVGFLLTKSKFCDRRLRRHNILIPNIQCDPLRKRIRISMKGAFLRFDQGFPQ